MGQFRYSIKQCSKLQNLRQKNGKDRILGYGSTDNIFGKAGNDRINTGADNDFLEGGAGDDFVLWQHRR